MSLHGTKLTSIVQAWVSAIRANRSTIRPNFDRHIIGAANKDVAEMRRPGETANSILVTSELRNRLARVSKVEGSDDGIDTTNCNDRVSILVPIVGQCLGRLSWRRAVGNESRAGNRGRTMDRDQLDQVVGGRGRST